MYLYHIHTPRLRTCTHAHVHHGSLFTLAKKSVQAFCQLSAPLFSGPRQVYAATHAFFNCAHIPYWYAVLFVWHAVLFVWHAVLFVWGAVPFVWGAVLFVWGAVLFVWGAVPFVWGAVPFVWCAVLFVWHAVLYGMLLLDNFHFQVQHADWVWEKV